MYLPSRRLFLAASAACAAACASPDPVDVDAGAALPDGAERWRALTEADWRTRLSPEAFFVLREHGTERAFSSPLNQEKRPGTYHCAGCDLPLFSSQAKYDSGTGWPSFWEALPGALGFSTDRSFFMVRTEYHCARCAGHQGHVFEDGPAPTGLRYCNNGVSLTFRPA